MRRVCASLPVADATQVVVGHDLRSSSPAMAAACAQAVRDAGKNVVFVGALTTPALAYYALLRQAPALIVTGSKIPFDRNGIKFYRAEGEITKTEGLGTEVISLGRTDTFVPTTRRRCAPTTSLQLGNGRKHMAFDAIDSTDGDADRPLIGDETGTWLRGDIVGLLCAQSQGGDVVVTP